MSLSAPASAAEAQQGSLSTGQSSAATEAQNTIDALTSSSPTTSTYAAAGTTPATPSQQIGNPFGIGSNNWQFNYAS